MKITLYRDSNYLYKFSYICQTFHQKLLGGFWPNGVRRLNLPSHLKQPKDEKIYETLGYKTLDIRQQMTAMGRAGKQTR